MLLMVPGPLKTLSFVLKQISLKKSLCIVYRRGVEQIPLASPTQQLADFIHYSTV
jgi:hypothetical protein